MPSRDSALLLRPWVEADAPELRRAIDDDVTHVKPWLSWSLEEPASLEKTRARLATHIEQFRTGQAYRYAITPADRPSTILGGASLNTRVGPSAHDVGYWVRKSAARQGIAAAAVAALVVLAFDERGVHRLVIQCDTANTVSAAFARHLGFQYAGAVDARFPDGSPRPVLQFEMVRERFRDQHEPALRQRARRVCLVSSIERAHPSPIP